MQNMIDLLFNDDGTINFENSIMYLPDIVSEENTNLMNRSLILDYVSEQTNIRADILNIYLDDMLLEKVLLNNPLPINILIKHRHFIVDQMIRLLAFDHSDYVKRFVSEEFIQETPLLMLESLCKHHNKNHVILEHIFKEVYFGLYDMYLSDDYPCRITPMEYLEFASEHLLCLFSKEFIFHHQHLFDIKKLLAFHEDVSIFTTWMFEDWYDQSDVLGAVQILIDKINEIKKHPDHDRHLINTYSKRVFNLQSLLSNSKLA